MIESVSLLALPLLLLIWSQSPNLNQNLGQLVAQVRTEGRKPVSAVDAGPAALLSALRRHAAGLPRVGSAGTDADGRQARQLVAGAGRQRCEAWARRGVAAFVVRPDPATRPPAPAPPLVVRCERPASDAENSWNLPHGLGKVKPRDPVARSKPDSGARSAVQSNKNLS